MDWRALVVPHGSLLEMVVRGTVVYLALFCALRVLPRRQMGVTGVSDILLIVIIADAAQNSMAGEYTSITEGLVLVATIIAWDYAIDWLDYRYPALRLNRHEPTVLVRDGRKIVRNMRREHISDDELMSMLRQEGLESLTQVKNVYVEGDGHVAVIKRNA
jgi:uncharacterized membrane protein YcaP (DUF421 family)